MLNYVGMKLIELQYIVLDIMRQTDITLRGLFRGNGTLGWPALLSGTCCVSQSLNKQK